jgi:putative ABC transport system permease protein
VKIQPLTDIHLHHSSGDIKLVYIFSLVACIILAIACINYMNLTTARYSRRAKEVGVRKVIGANRNNLLRQFFGETILLSIISLLVAIALIEIALPFFNNLTGKHLVFNPLENIPLIIAFLIIAILVGVGAGLYPAFFLSSFQPVTVLKNAYKSNGFNLKLRSILVVTQFSIAVVLIICAMIISKQHNYMLHKELGYNVDHVLYLTINRSLKENYYTFKNKLLESPLIKSVTCASSLPMSIGNFNPIEWEGKHTDDVFGLNFAVTDHDYINTLNMKIVEGRDFSVEFPSDTANFIINRKAVDLLQLENPLGTKASFMGADGEIIGIVDNFHDQPLYSEVTPLILTINPQNYGYFLQYVLIRVTGSNLSDAMSYIKETSKVFAPNFPCDYNFLDDGIGKLYASVRQTGDIINAFSILAIFISCLGLLGLASFIAEQRTKEIGVRKVLGASISNLLFLIAKDFAKYVIIANLIAWPIAYYACIRFLDNFAYRTSITFDMFVIAGFLALCISLLSVSGQALKAALAYPVDSLRYE